MITKDQSYSIQTIKQTVEQHLDRFIQTQWEAAQDIDESYARLLHEIRQYVAGGGKRLRPYLLVLAYQGYGGTNTDQIIPIAAAWELLHAALLVHDDIIDRDDVRHGVSNIMGRYKQIYASEHTPDIEHYASSSALLAGDLLISFSQQIVLESEITPEDKLQMLGYLNQAIFLVGGGEQLDTETVLYALDKTDARKIAHYKTATYSVELPLISGAVLAGASPKQRRVLRQIGSNIGIAFQLIDDLLGVFGATAATGKSVSGDIVERKHTVLVQEAYARLKGSEQQELRQLYSLDYKMTEAAITRVRQLLIESGAKAAVEAEAAALTKQAESLIHSLDIQDQAKTALQELIEVLLKRNA